MKRDPRGIPVTTDDPRAIDALEAATRALLGHRADTGDRLDTLVERAPELVSGRVLRGFARAFLGRSECIAAARCDLHAARRSVSQGGATDRERLLVAALGLYLDGEQGEAMEALDAVLDAHPRDALTAKLAHSGWFVLGRAGAMRRVSERILPAWSRELPGYSQLLGCHGFSLEETGDYSEAEAVARRAVELDPTDLWAGHAVGHVLEMEGRVDEGIRWLRGLAAHTGSCNNLRFHVHWHEALFHLARGDHDAALDLYDRAVRVEATDDYRDHSNGVTLLWRLEREGVDVGDRWEELAEIGAARRNDPSLAFAVVHYGVALVGAGRFADARRLADDAAPNDGLPPTTTVPEAGERTQTRLSRELARPIVRAFLAFAEGRPGLSVALLHPLRHRIQQLGGSHAQRDVFHQFLVDAALAAGDPAVARQVLDERAADRSGPNAFDSDRRAAILASATLGPTASIASAG